MEKYEVTGMSCAACQTRVEKAVSKVPGVTECSVSLLTNSMGVTGTANPSQIIKAVENAGYGAKLISDNKPAEESTGNGEEINLENQEILVLIKRLCSSVIFLLILMYVSMGHMMWNWPLPAWFNGNHVAMGLLQLLLTSVILIINRKFFISGFKSVLHGAPNMDTLVALGSGVSFVYSTVILFGMTDAVVKGNSELVMHYMDNFYFESAAMIVTLITVGKLLEAVSKGKTTNALKNLIKLSPKTATLLIDGKEVETPIEKVKVGDIFVVRPGENIPVDGILLAGNSTVNEAILTGESIPVDKTENSEVSAATTNMTGFMKCQATRVGKDTTLSQIIKMVSDAAATKAPIAKIADKVSGIFVPAVICISIITMGIWLLCKADFSFALSKAITVLVVSCPCALGLATPVAIMVGNGVGAKNGILFKTSASLESAGKTKIVALDKTGTITIGKPEVIEIITDIENPENKSEQDEKNLLELAYSLEAKSEHPLGKAVAAFCLEKGLSPLEVTEFEACGGKGVSAVLLQKGQSKLYGGNFAFIKENCPELITQPLEEKILRILENLAQKGQTPIIFVQKGQSKSLNNTSVGIISLADTIKPDAPDTIRQLKNLGIEVVMLTGDNQTTARAIASQAGIENVIAEVLPQGKEKVISELMQKGKVAMVGDGINDAPALTRADLGIAIGAGADVAVDAADVILVKNRLADVPAAINLSRKTLVNIKENLFWAFFYNVVLIPVAAGAWYKLFGLQMNPMFGAAAMSLSSFCVVTNALRLNLANIRKTKNKKYKLISKETNMEKTIKVEGMMCGHCEAHVKEALEKIKGVESATPNHTTGEVKLTLSKEVKDKDFEKAITKAGYKFINE